MTRAAKQGLVYGGVIAGLMSGCSSTPETACDAEPLVRTTADGVEFTCSCTIENSCDLIEPYDFLPWFTNWMRWSMKGRTFSASHLHEALTWYDLPAAEEAAYDAPFPSRIYMAAPRSFPSLSNTVGGTTAEAWQALTQFERPLLTVWGNNDYLNIGFIRGDHSFNSTDTPTCASAGENGVGTPCQSDQRAMA